MCKSLYQISARVENKGGKQGQNGIIKVEISGKVG